MKGMSITFLYNSSLLHYNDFIRVFDGWKSVSDNKGGNTSKFFSHLVNSFLYLGLIDFVESTGGFVEDEDLGLFDEGASEGNTLLLAAWELTTALSDFLVNTIRVLADKAPGVSLLQGLNDLIISGVGLAHENVLLNSRVE